jgi:ATP-binding cassette subfamily F protein 3
MSLLSVAELSFRYLSTAELFRKATFAIGPGDRLAIVGPNGAGKSTMLRILAGDLQADDGTIVRQGSLTVASAGQECPATAVSLFDHVFGARQALTRLRDELAAVERCDACRFAELVNDYALLGGYAAEADTQRVLGGLGFAPHELALPLSSLSGGQRTRAGLARALHSEADLLLLDEPTNHLDIAAREWLELRLADRGGACVIASHDRTLLRRVASRILEIERGRVRLFAGGYDEYRSRRALVERQAWDAYEGFERRRAAAEQASQRRCALARKVASPPAGERSRNDFYEGKASRVARTARLLRERVDREPAVAKPWEEERIPALDFAGVRRSGDIALSVSILSKSFAERTLFRDVSFELRRGERLAITGPNGSGKTTLLRVVLGLEAASAGTVRFGSHVVAGHYAQDAENLERSATPLQICGAGTLARTLLGCLKVRPDRIEQPLADSSSGERAKVALVRLLVSGANLLLLDEPTNHLDIEAQEALEQTLRQYPGTMVVVSHDRSFLDAIAADRTLAF